MSDAARIAEMCRRLRRVDKPGYIRHTASNTFTSNATYINPDGPAAAKLIEALAAELEKDQ
jgi:hypothetical protein